MKIILSEKALVKLSMYKIISGEMEFSGFGIVEKGKDLLIEDVDLLNIGSFGYTEIPEHRQVSLPLNPKRKLWFHRHPMGDGIPGPHNWSGRDNQTAEREPFGGIPELVQWSVSIVLTPRGWVGRLDIYLPKLKTFHLEVTPQPTQETYEIARGLITPSLTKYADELREEFFQTFGRLEDIYDESEPKKKFKKIKKPKKDEVPKIIIDGINIFRRLKERL